MVKFSIVIPVGPERKAEVIESLKGLDYKKKYEIIIEGGKNPSINRNNGVKKSKGDVIVFLDDDAYVDKYLLKNAEDFFENSDADVVGGPQLTPKTDNFFAKLSGAAISSYFGTQKMSNRYKLGKINYDGWNLITSANCFVKKNVFDKIGGFNPELYPGEDPEFFYRAKKNGLKIVYNPKLVIYHKRRPNIISFLKQFYLYGKARLKTGKTSILFLLPSVFFIYVLGIPLIFAFSSFFYWYIIPFLGYSILSVLFASYCSFRGKIIYFPFLPVMYLLIHLGYGCGLIIGLFGKLFK